MANDRKGKCSSCGRMAEPGNSRCQVHIDKAAEVSRAKYARRKTLGVCSQQPCERPLAPGKTCCQFHLDYHKAKTAANREAYAPRQRELALKWRDEKLADGICPQCNERQTRPDRTTCEICGPRKSASSARSATAARNLVLAHYGATCSLCDESEIKFLQIDHVEGGGNEHRREIGWAALYRWLIDNGFPRGFRTLCASCNFEKGLLARTRLGPVNALPLTDIPCFYCKTEMARSGRKSCHPCALKRQPRDKRTNANRAHAVFDHYGRECACCRSTRALQIDHIEGGGNAHRREIGRSATYLWLIKNNFPADFQTLCANCNFAKGHYKTCPHQTDTKEPA